jgi:hypothetical protein
MKSFSILRTNVGLTTNVKVMVDSNYNLFLESINSVSNLNIAKYKRFSFNKENYYDELVPYFWNSIPTQLSYFIKNEDDEEIMSTDFSSQFDDLYSFGGRNISNNKNYTEEYEYFAPLYLNSELPSNFIIFRVDGIGLDKISKINFKHKILSRFKTVKLFDLSKKTNLGFWLDRNFINNKSRPIFPFEMSFQKLEFSRWYGIDYKSGGYIHRSRFLDDFIEKEREIFDFERMVFDGYKNNSIIFPNILNLSFLFDDTPADKESLRKWSINRYYGFYLNSMDLVKSISPIVLPKLKVGVKIEAGNKFSGTQFDESPFEEVWDDNKEYYVEYNNDYYKVEKYIESYQKDVVVKMSSGNNTSTDVLTDIPMVRWKIISDLNLDGKEGLLNQNNGKIIGKKLYDLNDNLLTIDDFDLADVYLIEIDGVYHNLIKNNSGELEIITDWTFSNITDSSKTYSYYVNKLDSKWKKTVDLSPVIGQKPIKFNIWRLNFTDIKDFDTRIVDTEYSKFEYDYFDKICDTDETKMYFTNLNSTSNPPEFDTFNYKDKKNVHIPVSSEYTANGETFKIEDNKLTPLWKKNPIYCRWVWTNSNSANDYPYLLNNSILFEKYNRTTNIHEKYVSRYDRNLDYFYTINPSYNEYVHHTLHVQDEYNTPFNFDFDFDIYKGVYATHNGGKWSDIDYFTWFFKRRSHFVEGDIVKNSKKYSYFNKADKNTPNSTLFRGIKFLISDIENVKTLDDGQIDIINTKNLNNYEDYKLSVLMTSSDNGMKWTIIDEWKVGVSYKTGDLVRYDDIIFECLNNTITNESSILTKDGLYYITNSPFNNTNDWGYYYIPSFWSLSNKISYIKDDIVYKDGDWYLLSNPSSNIDFWTEINYDKPYCIYKGEVWKGATSSQFKPDSGLEYYDKDEKIYKKYWTKVYELKQYIDDNGKVISLDSTLSPKWVKIPMWDSTINYKLFQKVIHKGVVYQCNKNSIKDDIEPNKSKDWIKLASLIPDTNSIYGKKSTILMNNTLYLLNENNNKSTLDNGVKIYVNKKWKNVLVNIYINDNTLPNIKNTDRDIIYNSLYNKLVANNFINYINKISNNFDFSDTLKYVIIENDYSIKEYDINNIKSVKDLPIIYIDTPDPILIQNNSLIKSGIYENSLIPNIKLSGNNISAFDMINFYNNGLMGVSIKENKDQPLIVDNYHGISNSIGNYIFRWSGGYSPLFYDIDVFKSNNVTEYYEIQISLKQNGNFSYDNTTYSTYDNLIKDLEKLNTNDITYQFLNKNNKYRFFEFLTEEWKNNEVLSIKFMAYNTNSTIWDKLNSIYESPTSKVYKRLVNNTPISKSKVIDGNYKFDTYLTYFGIQKEKIFRKVNRKESLLKLKDMIGAKSIYPMLDEFGYSFGDFSIFKSSWDFEYHVEINSIKKDDKVVETKEKVDRIDNLIQRNRIDYDELLLDFNSYGKVEDFIPNEYGKIVDTATQSSSGAFPIKIEENSVEANPFKPKNTKSE